MKKYIELNTDKPSFSPVVLEIAWWFKENVLDVQVCTEGRYSDLVWAGMYCWKFESKPIHKPNFLEKVAHSYTNRHHFQLSFDPKLTIFTEFALSVNIFWWKLHHLLKIAPIWYKLLKILEKNGPINIPKFGKKKGSLIYWWGWFCYPCLQHVPIPTFVPITHFAFVLWTSCQHVKH